MAGKKSREPIRPDDENILEKLRLKRSISIPPILTSTTHVSDDNVKNDVVANVAPSENQVSLNQEKTKIIESNHFDYSPPPSPSQPKLVVGGRLPRKKGSSSRSLQLLHSIESDIKKYCSGGDLVIINYLIKLGLEQIKRNTETIFANAEEM